MNIENFPTSESARRMMRYITGNGFYDQSYVGKWIFQIMGEEMDDARRRIEDELPYQAFPETATWGLRYHEEKYGLPVRNNLPYDERRKIILEKRNTRAPMNPYMMEKILENVTGRKAVSYTHLMGKKRRFGTCNGWNHERLLLRLSASCLMPIT